jgi:RNA polymerase sigma factor (sigma-70 family)
MPILTDTVKTPLPLPRRQRGGAIPGAGKAAPTFNKSGTILSSPASIEWTMFCGPGATAMTAAHLNQFIRRLRGLLATQETTKLTDTDLWERYVGERDEAAFETLLRRHGPMVLGVCRRILRQEQDAEDAFQATFLVLIRKAATLRSPRTLANWLHGVARRTALEARRAAAKRRVKEAAVLPRMLPEDPCDDIRTALDEELGRLEEKYRTAVVLCDLEGKTRKEVARQLGWAEGTVASRLARGRSILAKRLARRGFAGAAVAAALADGAAPAGVPSALVVSTVTAASFSAARAAVAKGVLSATVATLTEGVLKSMLLTKLKSVIAVLLVSSIATLSAGAVISRIWATEPAGVPTDGQEHGRTNPAQLHDQVMELKQQLQQMQKKIARLEQETLPRRDERNPHDAFPANRFKYRIPVEIGYTESKEGGRIEIQEVWGTRPRIEVGGQYLARGRYVLPPGERGTLYFYETAEGAWGLTPTANLDLQYVTLDKERGEFALLHGMPGPGYFHLHLTAAEHYSRTFANVYFGTGDNVWRKKP